MRTTTLTLLAGLLAGAPAFAQDGGEEAPEFLLGDLGVRIDLPKGWRMTKWADWEFKGESTAGDIFIVGWVTPIQSPITDPEIWAQPYLDKAKEMGGSDPTVSKAEVADVSGRDVALIDLDLKFAEGKAKGNMYGGTFQVPGQMFHFALVSGQQRSKFAKKSRDELIKRMEILTPAPELEFGATLEVDGITTVLPDGWRVPLKQEMAGFNKRISKLQIEDMSHCFLAFRPKGLGEPDAMVTCQVGKLLGVVDEYSFSGVDTIIQQSVFGGDLKQTAKQVDLADRVGFVYDLSANGLAASIVPYDQGLSRTWVVGAADDPSITEAAEAAVKASTYSGAHPAGVGEQISYYITYRPFSPVVLCPGLCCLAFLGIVGVGGGGLVMRGAGKDKYAALAEED